MAVTAQAVRDIIDTTLSLTQVAPFLSAANTFYDEVLSSAGHSAQMRDLIVTWLAAHYVAIRDPRVRSEKVDVVSVTYELGEYGQGLNATRYGAQAIAFDTSGTLAGLASGRGGGFATFEAERVNHPSV